MHICTIECMYAYHGIAAMFIHLYGYTYVASVNEFSILFSLIVYAILCAYYYTLYIVCHIYAMHETYYIAQQ